MKIGIDIDGTITAFPPLFSIMTKALRKDGHEVYIVTFRHSEMRQETENDLKAMGIEYDKLIMYNHTINLEWKAKQVVKYGLEAFFEDSAEVIDAIKAASPYCRTFHVRGTF